MGIRTVPTLGQIIFPKQPSRQIIFDTLFDEQADLTEWLQIIQSHCYLENQLPGRTRSEFDLAELLDVQDEDFKQAVRTTQEGFLWLYQQISSDPVFHNLSRRPQLPIPHQWALTLERLGSNGNGASVGCFSRNLKVGRRTVIKAS